MPTKQKEIDPFAYIESGFLDSKAKDKPNGSGSGQEKAAKSEANSASDRKERRRFRKTEMSAPRPRRSKVAEAPGKQNVIDPRLQEVWNGLPKNIEFLFSFYDDAVTANYYRGDFKETREELLQRLLNPELSLEETSRLLGVCPATVRRYTNRGWISHHRTKGGQRRFRLSDVAKFVQLHGRFPED